MSWVAASLLSAVFLGCYNLGVKHAVRGNAVLPLLFVVNLISAGLWLVLMSLPAVPQVLKVEPLSAVQHLQIVVKSALMAGSWMFIYLGLKRLPLSIAAPVQSTGPVWILLGAITLLGERLLPMQWLGVVITLGSFMALSFVGREEGISFFRDRAIWFIVAGTLLMGTTGLYDKYLFAHLGFGGATVQAWFSIYLVLLLLLPLLICWRMGMWAGQNRFRWRWSIPAIVVSLLLADLIYYNALRQPGALIAVVASLRRADVLVAFIGGVLLLKERCTAKKVLVTLCLLAGIIITIVGGA